MKTFIFHKSEFNETEDHILEFLYDRSGKKKIGSLESVQKLFQGRVKSSKIDAIIADMSKDGLIELENSDLNLTKKGIQKAEVLVRGYRLAQRLMVDVLGISPENADKAAHYMEHIVEAEVLDAISAFLGYPESSPDGKVIPQIGKRKVLSLRPILCKLSELEVGKYGKIRYIQNPEKSLSHLGIMPGEEIRLVQKKPSVVVEIGHTTVALDKVIARDIYVQSKNY